MVTRPFRDIPEAPIPPREVVRLLRFDLPRLLRIVSEAGPILRTRVGLRRGLFLNEPHHLGRVVAEKHDIYSKRTPPHRLVRTILGEGLLTSDGEHWKRQRRLAQPSFIKSQIEPLVATFETISRDAVARWSKQGHLNLHRELIRLTLEILGRTVMNSDTGSFSQGMGNAISSAMDDLATRSGTLTPLWVPTKRNRAFAKTRREILAMAETVIAGRREALEKPNDILTTYLESADEEQFGGGTMSGELVRDEVITLLVAGHETTAAILYWTVWELNRHPRIADRLRDEIMSLDPSKPITAVSLNGLSFTKMVVSEILRLYPPVFVQPRRTIKEDIVDGFHIPSGTEVLVSSWITHRSPRCWDSPLEFRPERFEDTSSLPKYAYLPFSGGPHQCIGRYFAQLEILTVLTVLVRRGWLEFENTTDVEIDFSTTLRPKRIVPVRFVKK